MAVNDRMSSWSDISQGTKDVEKYIGQKRYDLAMMKARQTLELMVNYLLEKNSIKSEGSLADKIDDLYKNRVITRTSADHYSSIRIIGKRAAQEGDTNPGRANEAYHLLSQEMYTFANEYSTGRPVRRASSSSGTKKKNRKSGYTIAGVDLGTVLRLLIPILLVIVLILVVQRCSKSSKKNNAETETQMQVTTIATVPETQPTLPETEAPATEPVAETEPEVPKEWVTTDTLRVRSEPSTSGGDRTIVGVLQPDTVVEYIEDYDDTWAKINYNGAQCYVSKQYLAPRDAEQ